MNEREIIINGRRLNILQIWFFNKDTREIERILLIYPLLFLLATMVSLVLYCLYSERYIMLPMSVVSIIVIFIALFALVGNKIFAVNLDYARNMEEQIPGEIITKRYLINGENMWRIYRRYAYEESIGNKIGNKSLEQIIIKSYGDKVFEDIKKEVSIFMPIVGSSLDEPKFIDIRRAIEYAIKKGRKFKIRVPYDFKTIPAQSIYWFYATHKGITIDNEFSKRAISFKTKEEMVDILNEEYTKRNDSE